MGRYAHPALAEREEIMLMRHEGRNPADIARATGRDRSTISREMRRNSFRVGAGPLLPGIDRATLLRGAQALLRASQDPRRRGARRARHAADRAGALVARADRRQDRGRTSGPVGVRVDHLPGRQRRQARLARAGARQTGHQGAPTPQGQAAAPEGRAESRMATLGRGEEFADFARVEEATGAVFYFALPHHPWQRGTNENTNGLVREYFPKGTDFDAAGDERVREVYDAISHRPRKRHGFRTPYEVHHSQTLHLL